MGLEYKNALKTIWLKWALIDHMLLIKGYEKHSFDWGITNNRYVFMIYKVNISFLKSVKQI